MKTNVEQSYIVLDTTYTEEEGQECFRGTLMECEYFVAEQSDYFMYKILPETE